MGYKSLFYIVLLPIILLLFKWGSIFFYFENISLELKYFLNFYDKQYFPLIKSLSELNFSPTYNDYYTAREVLSFPYASIIFHSILLQVFDLNMIIIAELIFYILSYLLVYNFLKKSGLSKLSSLATTILIFFSPVFLDYINFFFEHEGFERIKTLIFEYHLNSHRFPRPLVTDLYFYLSLIILINLVNNKLSENKDYVLLGISLSLLLQSFIYLFLVVGFAFILILLLHLISNRDYLKKQFKSLILLLIIFLIFTTPFLLQSIFAEQDYIKRIGLFSLDFEQKKVLFKNTVNHYLKIQNLVYLVVIFSFYFIFKKKFNKEYLLSFKLYLLLLLSSFIIPLIFIIVSPYTIYFKHFFDVKNLLFIIGIILISGFIIENLREKILTKKNLFFFYVFILLGNFYYYSNKVSDEYYKNKEYFEDLNMVILEFNNKLNLKKLNIFSNSTFINNYYIYKNQNISYPDGFSTALKDYQLEELMINSFKSLGYSTSNFEDLLSNKISWKSFNEIYHISHTKYQFSYLYTYSDRRDYSQEEINFLKNEKLFLSESIALSKSETSRLVKKFNEHKIVENIKPDIIIIDKKKYDIKIKPSPEYDQIYDTKYFRVLKLM